MYRRKISTCAAGAVLALLIAACGKNGAGNAGQDPAQPEVLQEETVKEEAAGEEAAGEDAAGQSGSVDEDRQTQEQEAGTEEKEDGAEDSAGEAQEPDAEGDPDNKPGEEVLLKDGVQKELGCFIGAAVTGREPDDAKVWSIVTTHFNAVTMGNELKPDCIFSYSNGVCPGTEEAELNGETLTVPKTDFSRAEKILDKILEWNEENPGDPIRVRGHVLVWHAQTPEWFFHEDYDKNKDYVDSSTMNKRLEWYIKTVLTHFTGEDSRYRDLFYGWDVVNEAVSDGTGTYRSDSENPNEPLSNDTHGSNSSWWHVYQSNEYIINAFTYANKYAPAELELYYNDYNECSSRKQEGILALLQAVKEKEGAPGEGTRISAMGMQGHYNMSSPTVREFETSVRAYAGAVGSVQITEFDMKASDGYDGAEENKQAEYDRQAERYKDLYAVMKRLHQEEDVHITGITFWGTVDHYSWLQSRSNVGGGSTKELPQCPLLFDSQYQPKPAFYVFAGE